jgi:uncharacterized cupredoxin-like copper-binding protein
MVSSGHDDDEGSYPCILVNVPAYARRSSREQLIHELSGPVNPALWFDRSCGNVALSRRNIMIDRNHTVYVLAAIALGVAPLSSNADETIHVKLTDEMIQLDPGTASAGRVTFEVNNAASGDTEHEFVVLKTDMDDAHLPVHKGQVTESRFKKMGEVEDLARGSTKRLSLKLAPGHYVLICNRPGHYEMGMHTSFVVAR